MDCLEAKGTTLGLLLIDKRALIVIEGQQSIKLTLIVNVFSTKSYVCDIKLSTLALLQEK